MPGEHHDNPPNPYPEHRSKEPSELGEKVDWMTYTHQELYDMVHTGVDLTSAASVKDNWTKLGTTLADVKDELISRSSRPPADGRASPPRRRATVCSAS